MQDTVMKPELNSALNHDVKTWELSMMQEKMDKEMLRQLAAMVATMSNPLLGCQLILSGVSDVQSDKVSGLAAAGNVDNDMRNQIGGDQSAFNNGANMTAKDAQAWIKDFNDLESFLKTEKGLGKDGIMDSSVIDNLEKAMGTVKSAFKKDWGNADAMAADMKKWVDETKKGKTSDEMKEIQNGFSTLNQTVSAFAATTNTSLQFESEQYKQFLGIWNNLNSMMTKFVGSMVRNQKTN